jgi:hypothetical protein
MSRAVVLSLLAVLATAGCSASGGSRQADLRTQNACRDRVSEIYESRNRGDIFAANSSMNSPLSANYESGPSSRGLSDQFAYGRMASDCERDSASVTTTPDGAPDQKR